MSKVKTKLPDWANEPLKFAFDPDAALKRGAFSKPPKVQDLRKSVKVLQKASK
jgi:hypothetical protein